MPACRRRQKESLLSAMNNPPGVVTGELAQAKLLRAHLQRAAS